MCRHTEPVSLMGLEQLTEFKCVQTRMFVEGHLGTWAIEITQLINYQNKTSLMRFNCSHLKFLVRENTDFNPFWINFKNLSQPFFY